MSILKEEKEDDDEEETTEISKENGNTNTSIPLKVMLFHCIKILTDCGICMFGELKGDVMDMIKLKQIR